MRDKKNKIEKNNLPVNCRGNSDISDRTGENNKKTEQPSQNWRIAYVVYVSFWFIILVNLLIGLWPQQAVFGSQNAPTVENVQVLWGLLKTNITEEMRFILIVAVMGALGGLVYSITLFAHYVGRKEFETSYGCWYVLRPLIGAILAVIFYLGFRGAFFTFSAGTQDLNVSGVAALGGIVGIFSQETMEKLRDVAENLFSAGANKGNESNEEKPSNGK
ncbi:MAG: hypothetical protein HXS48_00440 [Theionarchaea archaeon]|nr:MAG: hypothetical protein AYK19_04380 [Theionarchaea archaeon DG-70-1]MBU7025379.1 hypothetical protein [Theionarchaea archaeon]